MLEQEICLWSNSVMSIQTKIWEQCFQHQESTPVSLGLWKISTALQSTLFNLEQYVRMLFEDFSFVFNTIQTDWTPNIASQDFTTCLLLDFVTTCTLIVRLGPNLSFTLAVHKGLFNVLSTPTTLSLPYYQDSR